MIRKKYNILLAEDDKNDQFLLEDVLNEIYLSASLKKVKNGVELMHILENDSNFSEVLFLKLNMPHKSGLVCLSEINQNNRSDQINIIIYPTSGNAEVVDSINFICANYDIRKWADLSKLKAVIHKALSLNRQNKFDQMPKENLIVQP